MSGFSVKSLKNCNNSRSSNGFDMKLGPPPKFNKRNKATLENIISADCDIIFIFPIYG